MRLCFAGCLFYLIFWAGLELIKLLARVVGHVDTDICSQIDCKQVITAVHFRAAEALLLNRRPWRILISNELGFNADLSVDIDTLLPMHIQTIVNTRAVVHNQ